MKSELAKARDEWLNSDEGRKCCEGWASAGYLQNRLERAFIAGYNFSEERIKDLEAKLKSARVKYDVYKAYAEDKVKNQAERIKELEAENEKS